MVADLDRRGLLLLGAGALLAGCTGQGRAGQGGAAAPGPTGTPSGRSASPGSAAPAPLPPPRPWHPDPNDVEPAAKAAAVRHVERRGTTSRSTLRVVEAQYGGILAGTACVLVVCRAWTRAGGEVRLGGSTYDVRVRRSGGAWRVTAVHPSRPGPPAQRLGDAAREVLRHPRIDLPPASRADVLSGQVHDSVLTAMLALARRFTIGVSVVRSGHPTYVFGTSRLSDHPRGRAFDTWRIDGQPVVAAGTPRRLVTGFMEAAAAAGSYNVGGPYPLGPAPQFFSDATHHDHVHAGFTS